MRISCSFTFAVTRHTHVDTEDAVNISFAVPSLPFFFDGFLLRLTCLLLPLCLRCLPALPQFFCFSFFTVLKKILSLSHFFQAGFFAFTSRLDLLCFLSVNILWMGLMAFDSWSLLLMKMMTFRVVQFGAKGDF